MHIDIQSPHFSVTRAMRSHTDRQLHLALTFSNEHIRRIVVRLSDINGPRGGPDKCCHLRITLFGLHDVIIEDVEADLYVAINRAASRAARSIRRHVARRRDRGRELDHEAATLVGE
jgi:putative sigma-54 modulation protein